MSGGNDQPNGAPAPTKAEPDLAAALAALEKLPKDELNNLAEDLGIDATEFKTQAKLAAAVHERRQLINAMQRDAMLDVIRWGRHPVSENASKEQLAQMIARIKSMRFKELSERGLLVLAIMRNVRLSGDESANALIRKLKRQEGFVNRWARKRRAWVGGMVSSILGEEEPAPADYKFLPPPNGATAPQKPVAPPPPRESIREQIEDVGLFGGIANRVKRTADEYLNQKLDEIEKRIDKKLDEIDRRLAEWRDKEVANRLRIIKITLWASVIVAIISLIYAWVKVYFTR
jgi:hypothetical protein